MQVELKPHRGVSCAKKVEVDLGQYRIFVDGAAVGYVGYNPGSPVCLIRRFSPIEVEEIEKQVAELTNQESVQANMPPEVPEYLLNKKDEDELDEDDLD